VASADAGLVNANLVPSINAAALTADWGGVNFVPANLDALTGTESINNANLTVAAGILMGAGTANIEVDNNVSIVLQEPSGKTFTANHLGVLDAGQLPENFVFRLFRAGTNVSGTTTWAITAVAGISGGTVTITDGAVNIPTGCVIGRTASIQVSATRGGAVRYGKVELTRQDAAPPGGGGGTTSNSDNTLDSVSGTTMVAISDEMEVWTGASGVLTFAGWLDINALTEAPDGGFGAKLRWKVKPDGGSYSNVGSADIDEEYQAFVLLDPEFGWLYYSQTGSINAAASQTGLTASSKYFVQLWGARDDATLTKTVSFGGGVTVNGS
jgi:hypothetical protein